VEIGRAKSHVIPCLLNEKECPNSPLCRRGVGVRS
jgi:hypothetical protein